MFEPILRWSDPQKAAVVVNEGDRAQSQSTVTDVEYNLQPLEGLLGKLKELRELRNLNKIDKDEKVSSLPLTDLVMGVCYDTRP